MRFGRWHRPEPYRDTSRKRAAFHRKQRLEREALPLFADDIAATQHGADEEMARRTIWWDEYERDRRDQRAAWWRKGRARLFTLPDALRARVREIWRTCPYPADPASFADFLHQIAVGKLDPDRPPWVFHQERSARITRDPSSFHDAFRQIGKRKIAGGPNRAESDERLFCGNLGSGILFLNERVHPIDQNAGFHAASDHRLRDSHLRHADHRVEIEVRGQCSDADVALIEQLAQAAETRPVTVQRIIPVTIAGGARP